MNITIEDKIAHVLKLGYQNAQNAGNFENLILYLNDYTEYIESVPEFKNIIEILKTDKNKLLKELQITETKALKELNEAKKFILKFAKEEKVEPTDFRMRGVAGLRDYEAGRLSMSGIKSDLISNFLFEIVQDLSDEDKIKVYKKYGVENPEIQNTYGNYSFSKSLTVRRKLSDIYKSKRATEIWGCWDFLSLIPRYVPFLHGNDMRIFYEAKFNYLDEGLIGEYVSMMMLRRKEYRNNDKETKEFLDNYKKYATRVHFYINKEFFTSNKKVGHKNSDELEDKKFQVPVRGFPKLITKDVKGDYFCNGNLISVAKNTIYYEVFDILFLNHDQDGFLSYTDIEKIIRQKHPAIEDEQNRNKRIRNAISATQGFFRFAKVNNKRLKNKTPDGKKLVSTERGDGLKLYNQLLI